MEGEGEKADNSATKLMSEAAQHLAWAGRKIRFWHFFFLVNPVGEWWGG